MMCPICGAKRPNSCHCKKSEPGEVLEITWKDGKAVCIDCLQEISAPIKERKGLADKFLTSILEHRTYGTGVCTIEDKCQREKLTKTAIDHACEVIDEWVKNYASDMNDSLTLKKMLRESI